MSNLNQSLLSELNTGIIILDLSLKVKFINSSALTILDTTEKTSIGQKIDQLFFETPEGVDAFIESIDQKRSFTKTDAVLNLKRGTKVAVSGELEIREHEGKYYTSAIVYELEFMSKPEQKEQSQEQGTTTTAPPPQESDGDLPF